MKIISLQYIYLIIMVVLSISVLSDTYRKDDVIDIKVPCSYNNTPCNDAAICNITINYPNGNNMVKDVPMTNNAQYMNYTVYNTSQTGDYNVLVYCQQGTLYDMAKITYSVRSSGWLDISPLVVIIAYGIIALILCLIAFNLDSEHTILKIFFFIISIVLVIVAIPAALIAENVLTSVFSMSRWIFYLILGYLILYSIYFMFTRIMGKQQVDEDDED